MSASTEFIHPKARAALARAEKSANLRPIVIQTLGKAKQSAGTHGVAGTYIEKGVKRPYSACIDWSVSQLALRLSDKKRVVMNEARIKWFLEHLAEQGIAAFYRLESQGFDDAHIHGICAMLPMNHAGEDERRIVENQVIDWVSERNGLKSHATETFYNASEEHDQHIATLFAIANPEAAKRLPLKYRGKLI